MSARNQLTRRAVLRGLGSLTVLGSSRLPLWGAGPAPAYDCIVLGAGIAGVTAARDLHRAGFAVLLVEGSDRIGGRMYSRHDFVRHPKFAAASADYPIESGAEYVHVGDKPRYEAFHRELSEQGFTVVGFKKVTRNRLAFPGDWKKNLKKLIPSLIFRPELIPTVTLLPGIEDYPFVLDESAGSYIARRQRFHGRGRDLARYSVSSHTPGVLYDRDLDRCHLDPQDPLLDTISIAGIRYDGLPAQLFGEKTEYRMERTSAGGGSRICGYDSLPRAIAADLEDGSQHPAGRPGEILLEHRVERVERRGDDVAVAVVAGDGSRREILARAAISTFSVGMLDPAGGSGDALFGPLLTDAKRRALASVRMGPITKLSLEFKKGHWGCKSKMSVMSHPRGCARTFFSAFPKVAGRRRGPYVLTGLLMGRDHRIVRELDDEAAIRHLLAVLQGVFAPRADPWTPEKVLVGEGSGASFRPNYLRQDWEKDPFARGGNSFISYSQEVPSAAVSKLREELKSPLETLPLFWAGEATAPAYDPGYQPLSVHGAYISGRMAAEDVRRYLESGRDAAAFRNYYDERYVGARAAARAAMERRAPLALRLTAAEAEAVEAYAASTTEGDAGAALREIFRMGFYAQMHMEKTMKTRGGERAMELSPSPEDWRRLEEMQQETGLSAEENALALVRRGLVMLD